MQRRKEIPFVADVNDLWPEAMRMIIDIPVISDIIFIPCFEMQRKFTDLQVE